MSGGVTRGDLATLREKKKEGGRCWPLHPENAGCVCSGLLPSNPVSFFLHLAFSAFYSCEAEERNWRRLPQISDQDGPGLFIYKASSTGNADSVQWEGRIFAIQ